MYIYKKYFLSLLLKFPRQVATDTDLEFYHRRYSYRQCFDNLKIFWMDVKKFSLYKESFSRPIPDMADLRPSC